MPVFRSLLLFFLLGTLATAQAVVINEFQASNGETLADEDGDFEDWIELYNPGTEPVLLAGYGLSDDEGRPFRWVFPDIALGPGEFLVVFASNKDRVDGPFLHTNFAISSDGEELLLTAPDGTLLDFVAPVAVPRDISYGRQPDGTGEWFFFDDPTPGIPNTAQAFLGILDPPEFSHEGGFYQAGIAVSISHPDPQAIVRYSLNAATPSEAFPAATTAINIFDRSNQPDSLSTVPTSSPDWWTIPLGPGNKGTPLRARAFKDDWLPSPVVSRSFFVWSEGADRYTLPVASIISDTENFLDPDIGIYVPGSGYDGSNWSTMNAWQRGREWERPVHLEFFEADGALGFEQALGARIHGSVSRVYAQKSLRLYARNEYSGSNIVEYPLMPGARQVDGSPLNTFRRFLLRNSGTDSIYRASMLRDLFMQSLVWDFERTETQGGRPVVVFLNGEFWGLFNVRERIDPEHFGLRFGVDPARISILERNAWRQDATRETADDYLALRDYAVENDLADPTHFAYVIERLDPISKIECWAAHIYFNNTDWPHNNVRFWRYEQQLGESVDPDAWWKDGRWRWILFDTDLGYGLRGPFRPAFNAPFIAAFEAEYGSLDGPAANTLKWAVHEINGYTLETWPNDLFRALLENTDFRFQFINRMADLLNKNFRESRALAELDAARDRIASFMPEQLRRWRQLNTSLGLWNQNINHMRAFSQARPEYTRQHVLNEFDLEGTYELTIAMPPEGSARVRVNSVELEANGEEWTGIYFLGVPIEVEILPEFGHEFIGWEGAFEGEGTLLQLNPGADIALQPVLKEDAVTLHEVILPRFMQGESPDNNDRVPFSARLRIEGLLANALYRFANRVVTEDDPPTQNGAGNAIYFDTATQSHFRTTATPDFAETGTHGEFTTDAEGSYEGWFTLEPSGNARFGEPELFIRVLLNDGLGGEEYRHFLTTENTVQVLPFGFAWGEATGIYATSPLTPGDVVVLHDDPDGEGRPLTATLVADAGFDTDARYATFYQQFVSGLNGHFGALLPNLLPDGLRRIEAFTWQGAVSTAVYTSPDGFWPDNADTVNPDGGLGFPLALTLGPSEPEVFGDVNGDGVVNAVDVQLVINAALGIDIVPFDADINADGTVNAVDVQLVINAALGVGG